MFEKEKVSEALRLLTAESKSRSETAKLNLVFDEIEAAIQSGIRRSAILDSLQAHGITLEMKGFESALYRIRRERKKSPESKKDRPKKTIAEGTNNEPRASEFGNTDKGNSKTQEVGDSILIQKTKPNPDSDLSQYLGLLGSTKWNKA